MNPNNTYIFKYNQKGELYNYIELNRLNKILSFFKLEEKKLIRFDRISNTKQLIVFKNSIRFKQRFMAGESFISVFDKNKDESLQYNMPEKEKCITLIKNNVSISDFGKYVVEKWKKILENSEMLNSKNETPSDANTIKITNTYESINPIFSKKIRLF